MGGLSPGCTINIFTHAQTSMTDQPHLIQLKLFLALEKHPGKRRGNLQCDRGKCRVCCAQRGPLAQ